MSPDILRLVHGGARMVYVGKQKGFHTRTQDEIHELLCNFAMEGSSVLRLKGGDPFVFGRGGEEVQYLQQRNIKTHVIPGVLPSLMHALPLTVCLSSILSTQTLPRVHVPQSSFLYVLHTANCSGVVLQLLGFVGNTDYHCRQHRLPYTHR